MKDYIRLTDVLKNYWDELRQGEAMPHEDQIIPQNLERIWDDCFLAEVVSEKKFRYDFLGKNIIEALGDDLSKEGAEALVSSDDLKVAKKFSEVIKTKKPIEDSGEFHNSDNVIVKYRQLLLPVADDNGKVKFILGGMRWKLF